ncbi:hypothetical protein DOTSEDRAFT_80272 [Dothistroma septosporum NZE10]|uniref:Uncharacterized protein n=1 Tax=Dothistroma septosporum (strain NZE10 / CBS 128990) TaxID=675120 RepID=N1PNV6_DOTSN|nr:hypothetical protein DOTSEDRAFT_80272 [Dothistroma septosporum NZE10]
MSPEHADAAKTKAFNASLERRRAVYLDQRAELRALFKVQQRIHGEVDENVVAYLTSSLFNTSFRTNHPFTVQRSARGLVVAGGRQHLPTVGQKEGEREGTARKYHTLAIPAELRHSVYDFSVQGRRSKDSGSALIQTCKQLRTERGLPIPVSGSPRARKVSTLSVGRPSHRESILKQSRYCVARGRSWGQRDIVQLDLGKLCRERIDRISLSQCAIANMLVKLEQEQ